MARGSSIGRGGEYISHVNAIRLRLNGTGELDMRLIGLDDIRTFDMLAVPMSELPGTEPTRLANFRSQRTRLEITTDQIDEFFRISRIVVFTKTSATSYPGTT